MFRSTPPVIAGPTAHHDVAPSDDLVPLVVLELSLGEPGLGGWPLECARRGITIVEDDIGRPSVTRSDAKRLIAEKRADEARQAQLRAAAEKRAIEQDQAFRAQLGRGIPASAIPAGMTYAAALMEAELDAQAYRPSRASMAEDLFDNSGTMTFHSLAQPEGDES